MYGAETSSSSSTIAKCWEPLIGLSPGSALSSPRSAILAVIRSKALPPSSVNSNLTIGSRVLGSKSCSGFLMSVPDSAGLSWITQ